MTEHLPTQSTMVLATQSCEHRITIRAVVHKLTVELGPTQDSDNDSSGEG